MKMTRLQRAERGSLICVRHTTNVMYFALLHCTIHLRETWVIQ
jgi:hypothetical protein